MGEWRKKGTPCPIDEEPATYQKCGDCRFFRGMSILNETKLLCNWPRNGTEVYERPIPKAFTDAEWET